MARTKIDELQMEMIIDRIYEGRCVPFLGAAANVKCKKRGYDGLPLGAEVARKLAERMKYQGRDLEDLARLALQYEIRTDRSYLIGFLKTSLDQECRPSPLLRTLAKLPPPSKPKLVFGIDPKFQSELDVGSVSEDLRQEFGNSGITLPRNTIVSILEKGSRWLVRNDTQTYIVKKKGNRLNIHEPKKGPFKLIVTTNYDRLLERALDHEEKAFVPIIQPAEGFEDTPEIREGFEELERYEGVILYKIHGSFLDRLDSEQPPPIIITEDDYIEFLTVVGVKDIGVPKLVLKRIIPSTLLFLGYSLEDWDFRTIYKGLIERLPRHQRRRSFAIQKDPSEFWVRFWQLEKKVEIYNIDVYDFAEQLEESYRAKYG